MDWEWKPLKLKRTFEEEEEYASQEHCLKYTKLDTRFVNSVLEKNKQFECHLSPMCRFLCFTSIDQYEEHYAATHTNICSVCKRLLPTPHLLHVPHYI